MTHFSRDNANPSLCLKSSKFQILGQHRLAKQNVLIGFCFVIFIFYFLQAPLPFLLTVCLAHSESYSYDILRSQFQAGTSRNQMPEFDVHWFTCLQGLPMVDNLFAFI